jgi:hypothetical protein
MRSSARTRFGLGCRRLPSTILDEARARTILSLSPRYSCTRDGRPQTPVWTDQRALGTRKQVFTILAIFCHPGTNSFQGLGIFHWRLTIKGGDNMPYRIGTSQQTAQGKTAVNIEAREYKRRLTSIVCLPERQRSICDRLGFCVRTASEPRWAYQHAPTVTGCGISTSRQVRSTSG